MDFLWKEAQKRREQVLCHVASLLTEPAQHDHQDLDDVSLVLQALLLMQEKRLGERSFWSEYIKLMPHPACPFYFSAEDLKELQNTEIAGESFLFVLGVLLCSFITQPNTESH